jgi:hypothetical protein
VVEIRERWLAWAKPEGREDKGGRKENKEKENKIIFYF